MVQRRAEKSKKMKISPKQIEAYADIAQREADMRGKKRKGGKRR